MTTNRDNNNVSTRPPGDPEPGAAPKGWGKPIASDDGSDLDAALAGKARMAQAMDAFSRLYSAIDRVLSPNATKVHVYEYRDTETPAWTDEDGTIWLNSAVLPRLDTANAADLAVWLGANAHELGHTLFSPRPNSKLWTRIRSRMNDAPYLGFVFNLAEDQRQERLLVAKYRPLRAYLATTIDRFVLGEFSTGGGGTKGRREAYGSVGTRFDTAERRLWLWVAGRTWLPADVRRRARKTFAHHHGEDAAARVASLIGRYQRLADPAYRQADEAFDLLWELMLIMGGANVLDENYGCSPYGNPQRASNGAGAGGLGTTGDEEPPPDEADEIDDAETADDDIRMSDDGGDDGDDDTDDADADADADTDEGDGGGDGDGDGADGEGSGDDDADADAGDGSGDADGDGADGADGADGGDSQADSESDGEGTGDGGKGVGKNSDPNDDHYDSGGPLGRWARKAIMSQVLDDLAADAEIRNEVRAVRAAIDDGMFADPLPLYSAIRTRPVPDDTRAVADHLGTVFRGYTDNAIPYWEREVDHGKLNVRRYLTEDTFDYDTMFDRFEPGQQDEVSLDVVVMIDSSGSMSADVGHACEAAWAIKRAVTEAEGSATILTFDTYTKVISDPDTRLLPDKFESVGASGGTNPTVGLRWARHRWRQMPQVANKVLVILTDGMWGGGGQQAMASLRADGAITIGFVLDDDKAAWVTSGRAREHRAWFGSVARAMGTEHTHHITDPRDMVAVFEEVATKRLAEATSGQNKGWWL